MKYVRRTAGGPISSENPGLVCIVRGVEVRGGTVGEVHTLCGKRCRNRDIDEFVMIVTKNDPICPECYRKSLEVQVSFQL